MANVFAGEASRLDPEVLHTVHLLPDDFWVFAEFNTVGRNVDWLIIREAPEAVGAAPSTLIVTELKRLPRPLRGRSTDEPWEILGEDGTWQEFRPANERDINPYWQVVNTANAIKHWLWNNQPLYAETATIASEQEFAVWPDLLLLGPPGTVHHLPLRPPSRFGAWWSNVDDWRRHLEIWRPKKGKPFTARELERLVEVLRLRPVTGSRSAVIAPRPVYDIEELASLVRSLQARVERLEAQVEQLRS
ncbi:MAG: hypothetical protein RMM58_07525 [Chloroflexota bacterium]|nr:hypothetical protein [Dehalococcoidia bacterium]MDW8253710.1 hypothetical protein [Chloroflexota bacterium]